MYSSTTSHDTGLGYISAVSYIILQAESNVQGILVSDPKDGVPSFGLVEKGKQQAKEV